MKRFALAMTLALLTAVVTAGFRNAAAETPLKDTLTIQGVPYIEAGQSYKFLVGAVPISFRVLAIYKNGIISVQAVEDAEFIGIKKGTAWQLNLNHISLVGRQL